VATHTGEAGVAEVFRTLQHRLRDSAWTIVFKALIIVHLLIREGQQDAALLYLSDNPKKIAPSNFSEGKLGSRLKLDSQEGLADLLYSSVTGKEHPPLCGIPHYTREGIRGHSNRLCTKRIRTPEALKRGKGPVEGNGICTKTDSRLAAS